ncbi:Hypothetical predicted protein, partial [Marmota monax]
MGKNATFAKVNETTKMPTHPHSQLYHTEQMNHDIHVRHAQSIAEGLRFVWEPVLHLWDWSNEAVTVTYMQFIQKMKYEEIQAEENVSTVVQFVLLGFSELPNLQGFLSGVFSIIYMVILIGNSLIVIITRLDPALHKPMYFFLAHFSILEICYVSVTLPRYLVSLWTWDRSISLLSCATQMCLFLAVGTAECFLLAVMAYDRYVAICNPLHYPLVMTPKKCHQLAIGSWLGGMPVQIGQTCRIFSLHFCHTNQINHFFCDIPPILKLACGDTSIQEISIYVVVMLVAVVPFLLILASYSKIISTILRLPTAQGRTKMKHEEIQAEENVSTVVQFVLLGFSELPNLQGFLPGVFSIIYVAILIGNSLIVIITRLDPALHKPMYFFLAHFSILEICYVSVTLPRILVSLWTKDRRISLLSCATQLCFFLVLGTAECFFLAVMAYDCYVALCNPLHYPLVMNPRKCHQLAIGSWLGGMPVQIGQTCQIFTLHFCYSNQINRFFCDIPPIFKLACGDISVHELSVYIVVMLAAVVPFVLILASYIKIIATILRLPTAQGRTK